MYKWPNWTSGFGSQLKVLLFTVNRMKYVKMIMGCVVGKKGGTVLAVAVHSLAYTFKNGLSVM